MKASDLVKQLQTLIEKDGDLTLTEPLKAERITYIGLSKEQRIDIDELEDGDYLNGRKYTGYSDKHGVDIYVGDIVKNGDCIGVVTLEYDDQEDEDGYFINFRRTLPQMPSDHLEDYADVNEVIGNVDEDTELIKEVVEDESD